MKLFGWVQEKFNGRSHSNRNVHAPIKNQTPQVASQKEEFSDWPQGFLSIGTLFTKPLKDNDTKENSSAPSQNNNNPILDLTLEEVKELQKELSALISSNDLDCFSTSEAGKKGELDDDEEEDDTDGQHSTTMVPNNKAKDVYMDNNGGKLIGKKSLSFLLKKVFVCGVGGFGPTPSLRDPTYSVPKTRLSKILRTMLRKKIYPQNSCPDMSRKKYLGNRKTESSNYDDEDEFDTKANNRIKWDKSDTDYIVLEM